MTARKLTLGAAIESWCTKCKDDRQHAVETLKPNGTASKVRCNTCNGSHLFRPPKGAAAPKPAAKQELRGAAAAAAAKKRSKPELVFSDSERAKAKPYAMDREHVAGEVISHPKFGLGRVMTLKAGGKMEVSFEGGPKLLVCKDIGSLLLKRATRAVPKPVPEVEEVEEAEVEADEAAAPEAAPAEEEEEAEAEEED
jgi:hypothetical protein